MKLYSWLTLMVVAAAMFCMSFQSATAAVHRVDISPPAAAAANLGTLNYPGDHAIGLSPQNESNKPVTSATGGVFAPMSYDTVSRLLTLDFAYGSAFGFVDLGSNWNGGVHIHGNGSTTAQFPANNTNAGITVDLGGLGLHTASGTRSGRVAGNVTLTPTQHDWLLDNKLYLNVHSQTNGGGEVRGQLVLVPEPATLGLAAAGLLALAITRSRRTKS